MVAAQVTSLLAQHHKKHEHRKKPATKGKARDHVPRSGEERREAESRRGGVVLADAGARVGSASR